MTIDLAVLTLVFVFGLFGLWTGAIRQLANLGAIIAGAFAARPLAQLVGPDLAERLGYPVLITTVAVTFVTFFGVYVIAFFMLRFVLGYVFPDGEQGALNRGGGFFLGAAKGAALCFLALCAVVLMEKHLASLWRGYQEQARQSLAVRAAHRYNLFARLPQLGALERLANGPERTEPATRTERLERLTKDPRIKALLADGAVQRAARAHDYPALLANPRVREVLADPKLAAQLAQVGLGSE